ncbi:ATP synthase complex assembly protein ATP12 NDAI_0B00350 [Naumovozyma dairenensis CBS 421]|uniref:Uncharacterized protein n=1 Tax=Naumovozyma dairenensis (strain ATCC 10597 / BCRC 20456 / CBS 421 / NBRC 0211 / NRRL Y-12639) TaxID=1071378 RepID=G0W5K8_NAUDC|nr:hypothetical protein NDAI_0B00350 [Naumovozyma dairenensis CBS 421]CCD23069.1 hypothetical protein NDAI_0B00350 [Naumovozyma dairenensis CBS 421]
MLRVLPVSKTVIVGTVGRITSRQRGFFSSIAPIKYNKSNKKPNSINVEDKLKKGVRFWETVTLDDKCIENKILIKLDSKPIKTPSGFDLSVDKNRPLLAYLLRQEWATLPTVSMKNTDHLPLTSLVFRCIDLETAVAKGDKDLITKINADRSLINEQLLRYLDTDTLLVFSPRNEFEGALRSKQDELYLPIIAKIERFLNGFKSSAKSCDIKLRTLDGETDGIRGNKQNQDTKNAAINYMKSLSMWDLAIFERVVLITKSFICGILLLQNKSPLITAPSSLRDDLQISTEDIAHLATLEIFHQTERWGEVEDTHDVNKRDIRRNINAAAIVAYK